MNIICNVTGSERKRLAQALGEILLTEPVYMKAPTFAYVVSDYVIDKDGTISCPDSATPETVAEIISKLTDEGFSPAISEEEAPAEIPAEMPDVAPEAEIEAQPEEEAAEANVGAETPDVAASEEDSEAEADQPETDTADEEDTQPDKNQDEDAPAEADDTKLTISIPRAKLTDDALVRLRTMVSNKEELFKRALLTDALPIEVTEDKVSFPWFTLTGIDGESTAYAQFITALCQMATEQTRVLDKPYDGDNDRFAMRIFMVRLGMKGAEFALARKLMMKHLTGNSGWRYGDASTKSEHRGMPNRTAVQHLKKAYPCDTRVELIPMSDESGMDIHVGAHGKMIGVDDNGSVFIKLDNGSVFGIAFSTEHAEEADAPAEDVTADSGENIANEDAPDSDDGAADSAEDTQTESDTSGDESDEDDSDLDDGAEDEDSEED